MNLVQILMLFTIFMINPSSSHARTKRARPISTPPVVVQEEDTESGDEEEEDEEDSDDEEEADDPQMPWGQSEWLAMYANFMVNRKIRVERKVKTNVHPNVIHQLTTRNWLGICSLDTPCYDELVKWFYASAIKTGRNSIMATVRGVQVVLNPRIISELTGAPSVNAPTYPIMNLDLGSSTGKKLMRKVLKELTDGNGVSFSGLPQGTLTFDYRFLHTIVTHNLLPVGRFSTVTWERGLFLYCVMKGYSIDLPQVVFDYIASFINMHRRDRDQLPFGSLISKICLRASVQAGLADAVTPREGPIGFKRYTGPVSSSTAPSSSTTAVGSVQEAWMNQPPSLTPMSACANLDDLIGAMGTFKLEQHAVNQYQNRYFDALYRQRNDDDSP